MQLITSLKLSKVIIIITLLFMIFLAYLSFARLQNLIEYGKLVDDTNHLKYKTARCLSYLKDAETGQRGFLLTQDSIYLDPMNLAKKKIYTSLDELSILAQEDKENIRLITEFKNVSLQRMKRLDQVILADPNAEGYNNKLIEGKQLMDNARILADLIINNLEKKLSQREIIKNRYVSLTPIFMILLSLISILLIYFAYRIISNELRKRISMQNELQYNVEALKRSNSELEQFAYVASHDLQEPLRKIQSFGDRLILKHREKLDDDGKFIIDRMQNAAERMQVLINDLLSYSRISNTRTKKFIPVDLNQSLKSVLDVLNEDIIKKNAKVTTENLPVIRANDSQMEQLIQNLLTNAIKFMPEGRIPEIQIKYSEATGREIQSLKPGDENKMFHKISVSDNGIGFEEQYTDRIFIIFQRLHGKSEFSGSGIGLAMCKKILHNHDGYIEAKSRMKQGSEFNFYLPKD
ncbi:MAG: CHASE3 domain-containing protein [Bacteroidia bacterium]